MPLNVRSVSAAAGLWLSVASRMLAQEPVTLTGKVTSDAGQPLAQVEVAIPSMGLGGLSRAMHIAEAARQETTRDGCTRICKHTRILCSDRDWGPLRPHPRSRRPCRCFGYAGCGKSRYFAFLGRERRASALRRSQQIQGALALGILLICATIIIF